MRLTKWVTSGPMNSSRIHLDAWVREAAALGTTKDFRVLDAGAGDAPFARHFTHVTYETADLAVYEKSYAALTHVCDITDMPMPDDTYDLVLCTQTLEHTREPARVIAEIGRVLKPGHQAWFSAPFLYEEHEVPYDFYRFTQFAWTDLAERAGLTVVSIERLEGYYATLAYELHVGARALPKKLLPVRVLFLVMARWLAKKDLKERLVTTGHCKNYKVIMEKPVAV